MMKNTFFIVVFLTLFFVSCNPVKWSLRIAQKSEIANYNDEKDFLSRWMKKWDKHYSTENKQEFEKQAKIVLNKQMSVLKNYIKQAKEQESKKQGEYVLKTFNYVKNKNPDVGYLSCIKDLNEEYLNRAENLAKIELASNYADNSNYDDWQKKWNELAEYNITEKYQLNSFIDQSNKVLSNQMKKIKNYIKNGDEQNTEFEKNDLKDNYKFVRQKYPNYDNEYNKITDLNDQYIKKIPTLVKMQRAFIYMNNDKTLNWRSKWDEIQPFKIEKDYVKKEFIKQAKILLSNQIKNLEEYIFNGDEYKTQSLKTELHENYNFTRKKYPQFDNEENDITNLNDSYIKNSVNLAKIHKASYYMENYKYEKWIEKWIEIGNDISEKYLIDSFEVQSVKVFTKLYNNVISAKNNSDCKLWEQKSDLIVFVLEKTFIVYPDFDNFRKTQPGLQNIKMDYLLRLNRDAKICIAKKHLDKNQYDNWINKWLEINDKKLLNQYEINIFNKHCKQAFKILLNDIDQAINKGDYAKTQEIANKTLELLQNKVVSVNPNYSAPFENLNETYLYNAKFFAKAQKYYLSGKYKDAITYLKQNCAEKLKTDELKPSFIEFYDQIFEKNVEIYKKSIQNNDFDRQVDNLKYMTELYELKPNYISISFVPEFLNSDKKYKNFKNWLDWRIDATLNSFYSNADSLINQNLYTLAYDFVFERANKIAIDQESQNKIDYYNNIFETQGTDYYKSQINLKISNNQYLIAQNILQDDLLKINNDFNTDRRNEYNQIVNNIKNRGTKYYLKQRNKLIEKKQWGSNAHRYCDSIELINPTYNIERCNDEITFEEKYYVAENNFDNGNYFCAIDLCNEMLNFNVDEIKKSKARNLISDSKDNAVITVGVLVDNYDLNDNFEAYIIDQLQDYKNSYRFDNYLEITKSSYADYTINFEIDNFEYDNGWNQTDKKYACIAYSRKDERYKTETYKEKQTEIVGDYEYYIVEGPYENRYYMRFVNGVAHYLNNEGNLLPLNIDWDYVNIEKKRRVKYTVTQYMYDKVAYNAKYGDENMFFNADIGLSETSGGYLQYSKNKNFSKSLDYQKYDIYGSYNVDDLVDCPNASLGVWLDKSYDCGNINTEPFNNPSDPFYGKNEFYQQYIQENLKDFIERNIPDMMEKIKQKHIDMQCN